MMCINVEKSKKLSTAFPQVEKYEFPLFFIVIHNIHCSTITAIFLLI